MYSNFSALAPLASPAMNCITLFFPVLILKQLSKNKQICFPEKKYHKMKMGKTDMNEIKVVKNIFSQTLHGRRSMAGAKQQEFASKNESGDRALVRILIWGCRVWGG